LVTTLPQPVGDATLDDKAIGKTEGAQSGGVSDVPF